MTTPTPAAVLAAKIRNDIRTLSLWANIDAPIFVRMFSELDQLRQMAEGAQGEVMSAKCHALEAENMLLIRALETARDHIDMEALDISHCKDADEIRHALAGAPVAAKQAEPDSETAIRIWHKHCDPFRSKLGEHPPSVVINAMREFAACAAPAAVAPDGWVMVPRAPTDEMLLAAHKANAKLHNAVTWEWTVYSAMLDSAPTPPASTDRAMGADGPALRKAAQAVVTARIELGWCKETDEAIAALYGALRGAEGRKPLTDEQIDDLCWRFHSWSEWDGGSFQQQWYDLVRNVEAHHGIPTPPSGATSAEG